MKFTIDEIILWQKNGLKRILEFQPNKVNVITGDSGTGKSVIIEIIDYCLFASEPDIPQDVVNENVNWYGIKFGINDKSYTIARACLENEGRFASKRYYFSSVGDVPDYVEENADEDKLKEIIEYEFSIDQNIVFPFGGSKIKPGKKISFRYFMLFNTLRGDTISHSKDFFDKQHNDRYKEALPRIFDLATGITNIRNILLGEKIQALEKDIIKLERKQSVIDKQNKLFEKEIKNIIKTAKEYSLIDETVSDIDTAVNRLEIMISNLENDTFSTENSELEQLKKEKRDIARKIKLIKKFESEYETYKKLISNDYDSLRPVEYIIDNYNEIIENPSINEFLFSLEKELLNIKKYIKGKSPLAVSISKKIEDMAIELHDIESKIELYPQKTTEFDNEKKKYIFIGETKNKLSLYKDNYETDDYNDDIKSKSSELESLKIDYDDTKENRDLTIKLLEDFIQQYLNQAGKALDNYEGYLAYFDYTKKTLKLRKPLSTVPSVVGSSSNHLFLHICLFLGLHELIIKQDSPYVPNFLILDQPSRPYFEVAKNSKRVKLLKDVNFEDIGKDDQSKITTVFKLLNDYITHLNNDLKTEFQMIIFEHIPKSIWIDANLNNIHLVEEFNDGNALVKQKNV